MTDIEKLAIARCTYANGTPFFSDAEYDALVTSIRATGVEISPIYEDDKIPYDIFLQEYNLDKPAVDKLLHINLEITPSPDSEDFRDLMSETSLLSINPVFSFSDAFSWFKDHAGEDIIISPKIDGINTRRAFAYEDGSLYFKCALTRGRSADPLNVTSNMAKITPTDIRTDKIPYNFVIYSETVAESELVSLVNEKYGESYTLPRGLAMSMMRVHTYDSTDYKRLHSIVFKLDYGNSLQEGLDLAEELGFEVVPYINYTYNNEGFASFQEDMNRIIKYLKQKMDARDIVTDGMVAEVNSRNAFSSGSISNHYSSQNIALKIGLWEPGVYESEVIALDISPRGEQFCCVAVVKPVTAKSGQSLSRVNCFNIATLIANNITVGTTIRFEYKNETTINLLTKEAPNVTDLFRAADLSDKI